MALAVEDVVDRCRAALTEATPALAVRDALRQLVSDPASLSGAVGPVDAGGIAVLHQSDDLTVLHVSWTPGIALYPHDHRVWAVIGMYGGQDTCRELPAGDVLVMGDDVIHSVANTRREFAVALHVYGGNFLSIPRSEWDWETYEERPRDFDRTRRVFEEANARWRAEGEAGLGGC
jgi:predicted metal-dependent enzyme (double-stranded beta helix superfamily)